MNNSISLVPFSDAPPRTLFAAARNASFASHSSWIGAVLALPRSDSCLSLSILEVGRRIGFLLLQTEVRRPRMLGLRTFVAPHGGGIDLTDIGLADTHQTGNALCSTLAQLAALEAWDRVRFPRVRGRSNLLSTLPSSGYSYALSDDGASAFCDVSSVDALASISKDNLRNVDRLKRRAERDFGVVAIDSVTDGSIAATAFDRFIAVEDAGWKGTQGAGTSLASDARAQSFFREVMRRFQEDNRARIDFLTIAGRDAAAQLMVRAGPTWFLLKIGYHPDFNDVGPGSILLKSLLEEMVANPDILEVNLTTNPHWAARWHFQTEPVYFVTIYNTTIRGRLLYAGRSIKEVAKVARDRWQEWQSRRSTPPTT